MESVAERLGKVGGYTQNARLYSRVIFQIPGILGFIVAEEGIE